MACREFDFCADASRRPTRIRSLMGSLNRAAAATSLPRSFGRTCARASTTKTQSLSALRVAAAASASK
jgi:hypothetical protein